MVDVIIKTIKSFSAFCLEGTPLQLGQMIQTLMDWFQEKGAQATSKPTAIFHSTPDEMPPDKMRCEACVAARVKSVTEDATPLDPEPPIYAKILPEIQAACAVFEGPQSADAEIALVFEVLSWIKTNDYIRTGPIRQVYRKVWMEEETLFTRMETQVPIKKI
ncbi:MAG: GyrI-like domain-containing protein [Promethearchaeota archaeon]